MPTPKTATASRTNGNEVIAEAAASKEPIEVNGKATSQDESARNPKKGSTSAKEDIYPAVLELLLEMRDGMRQLLDHQTSSFQTKQSSNIQSKKTALQAKPGRQQSKAAGGKEWIYICFPQSEQRMQKKVQKRLNGDEDDEEESDESGKKSEDKKTRPIRDAMEAYPVSARTQQQEKRNPDIFDLIIFHDFAGYGNCEVIEDMFVAFDKEPRKKQKDPTAVCSVIESMASFLLQCDLGRWHSKSIRLLASGACLPKII